MNYKFKTKPYAHQLKALELSWDKPYFAYFMEMGTGKSKVLIDNIAMLSINTFDLPVPISIKYAKYGLSHDNSNAFN